MDLTILELTTMELFTITFVMYIISIVLAYITKIKYIMLASIVLWFVPIFTIDNIFIIVFSVIMITFTIYILFFNNKGDEW